MAPIGLYARLCHAFLVSFFFSFFYSSFLMISRRQIISRSAENILIEITLPVHVVVRRIMSYISGCTGPIFAIFLPYESIFVPNFVKIGSSIAAILRFFKFAAILDIWNREILLATGMDRIDTIKVGQSIAKTLWFFVITKWRPPPSCIVVFANFHWLTVFGGPDAKLYQISSKSVAPLQRYCDFSNFQDGRRRHLTFLKWRIFY